MEQLDYFLLNDICPNVRYFSTLEACFDFTKEYGREGIIILASNLLYNVRSALQAYEEAKAAGDDTYDFFNHVYFYRSCKFLIT